MKKIRMGVIGLGKRGTSILRDVILGFDVITWLIASGGVKNIDKINEQTIAMRRFSRKAALEIIPNHPSMKITSGT